MKYPNSKILYVDDEIPNLNVFKNTFRREYNIYTTSSPQEALEILKNQEISIIISDQRMPEMNGVDLLKNSIEISPDSKRILLTGYVDIKAVEEAINHAGIYQYIQKPWEENKFRIIINNALKAHTLQQEKANLQLKLFSKITSLSRTNKNLRNEISLKKRQEEKLLISNEDLEIINKLNNSVLQQKSIKRVSAEVVKFFEDLFNVSNIILFTYDSENKTLKQLYSKLAKATVHITAQKANIDIRSIVPLCSEDNCYSQSLRSGKSFIVSEENDIANCFKHWTNDKFNKSIMIDIIKMSSMKNHGAIPLVTNNLPFGLITFSTNENLSQDALSRMDRLAKQVAVILFKLLSETELEDSEQKFKETFNNAPIGIIIADKEEKLARVNQSFCDMLGYKEAELIGKSYKYFTHPDDLDISRRTLEILRRKGVAKNIQKRYIHKKGQPIWANITIKLQRKENGRDSMSIVIVENITDRKNIEEALIESENRHREAQKVAHVGHWTLNHLDNKLTWSDEAYRIFGLDAKKIKPSMESFVNSIHPDDRKRVVEHFNKSVTEKKQYDINHRVVRPSGEVRIVKELSKTTYNSEGKPVRSIGTVQDITELEKANEELKIKEERLKLATDNGKIGVWDLNLITNKLIWHDSMFKIFGISKHKFEGVYDSWIAAIHPKDKKCTLDRMNRAISQKKEFDHTYRIIRPDGAIRYIRGIANIHSENNKPTRVTGINIDITDLKKAEDEVRKLNLELENRVKKRTKELENEKNFSNVILDSMPGVFMAFDPTGRFLRWNKNFEKFFGLTKDEISKINPTDLVAENEKDKIREEMAIAMEKGIVESETFLVNANNEPIPYLYNGSLFETEDTKIIIGSGFDLSKQKLAEEELSKLHQAIEQSPVTVVITNSNGDIEYANPVFSKHTGYTLEEAIGKNPRILNAGFLPKSHAKRLWETILKGQVWTGEFCNKKKSGEIYWEQASISPVYNSQNKITHFVAVKEDITKQKRIKEELIYAKKQADSANKAKSKFLANMSHEIRTPMNAILGFSEILSAEIDNPAQKKYLSSIQSSGKILLNLINDILDLSKIEAGKLELKYNRVNLKSVINEIISLFEFKVKEKQVEIITDVSTDIPEYVLIDELRLRQVLLNIINNAVKFTEDGYIKISVKAIHNNNQSFNLKVCIQDTGIGIAQDNLNKIFSAFDQVESTDNRKHEGTGLGLAITKKIIEAFKGNIEVDSEIDVGSRFSVSIPNIQIVDNELKNQNEEKIDLSHVIFNQATILITDDIASNREVIKGLLSSYNFNIVEAYNGQVALEQMERHDPDLILMDIRMPIMDGYEALKAIKTDQEFKNKPVIALTASAFEEDKNKVLTEGFEGYMKKPVSKNDLVKMLTLHIPFKIINQETTPKEISTLSPEDIGKIPNILESLQLHVEPKWEMVSKRQSNKNIKDFANELIAVGKQNDFKELINKGHTILEALTNIDVEEINQCIMNYRKFVESIKTKGNNV